MYLDLRKLENPQIHSRAFKGRCVVRVWEGCTPLWDGPKEAVPPKPKHIGHHHYSMTPGPWMFYGTGGFPVRVSVQEQRGLWTVAVTRKVVLLIDLDDYTPPVPKPTLRVVKDDGN